MKSRRLYQVLYFAEGDWISSWYTSKIEAGAMREQAIREHGNSPGFIVYDVRVRGVPTDPEDLAIWLTAQGCGGTI